MEHMTMVFWTIDIVLGFVTGFQQGKDEINLEQKAAALHYLKSGFSLSVPSLMSTARTAGPWDSLAETQGKKEPGCPWDFFAETQGKKRVTPP